MSYFILKQRKEEGQINEYCMDSEKFIFKQGYSSGTQEFKVLMKLEPCIFLAVFSYISDSEPKYSYKLHSHKALAKRSRLFTIQRSTCMLSEMSRSLGHLVE